MRFGCKWMLAPALLAGLAVQVQAAPAVLQRSYDAGVTNANLAETTLNTSNVGVNTFGLLFTLPVDDNLYAQPLYVPGVTIPGKGSHNLLIAATMNDTVYAFDADAPGAPLWSLNLASLFSTTALPWGQFQFGATPNKNLGILSTPVIDPATNIMYVLACTLEGGTVAYRLHAIKITDGSEPYGPGVLIQASNAGVTFDARYQTQRVSLALAGNFASQVVFGFAAMEKESQIVGLYTGWVMAYDKTTLNQTGAFATVPVGKGGAGIWQSGRPPAVDGAGDFYVFTGNAWGSGYDGVNDFSESVLKFDVSNGLKLVDWFTPSNWSALDKSDHDLTSSGPMLIPGTSPTLLAGGGKTGDLYVLNTANLGKYVLNDTQVVQKLNITGSNSGKNEIRAGPAYWNRSTANGGPLLYNWGNNDAPKAFAFNGSTFSANPVATGAYTAIDPGGALAVSANGDQPGSGVLWASRFDPNLTGGQGALHAFDAANIANELWNSEMNPSRDALGKFAKNVPPVVVNGKVYLATWSKKIDVYGLNAAPPVFTLSPTSLVFGSVPLSTPSTAQAVTVKNNSTAALAVASITLSGAAAAQYSQSNNCGTSIAAGASCTINVVFTPSAIGAQAASLNFTGGTGGTKSATLSGTGVAAAFGVSPTSLAFGSVQAGTQSTAQPVTVTNSGTSTLSITGISFSGTGASQFLETDNCSAPIPVGQTCTVNVVFAPTASGSQSATLNVTGGGATQTVTVGGTGTVPFTVSPTSVAFGNVPTSTNSSPVAVTVTNGSSTALSVTGITISGTNASQFSQTNTCSAPIPVGLTCTVSVVFSPSATGSQTANLGIAAAGGTQNVALSGTGTGAGTSFTLSPATVAFGNVTANTSSAPLPVTVTNTGGVALTVSGPTITGGTPASFSQSNTCSAPVAAGSACTINVVFTPTAAGYVFSSLNVAVSGATAQLVHVNGTGVVPFSASPTSLAFGSVTHNTSSAPQVVTVTNTGTAALPLGITFGGGGAGKYSQTNTCGTSVAAGSNCAISVVFTPTASGTQSATLKLRAPGAAQDIPLTGTGT